MRFIASFLELQRMKVEHHHPMGLLYPHEAPKSKWQFISMDFAQGLQCRRISTIPF